MASLPDEVDGSNIPSERALRWYRIIRAARSGDGSRNAHNLADYLGTAPPTLSQLIGLCRRKRHSRALRSALEELCEAIERRDSLPRELSERACIFLVEMVTRDVAHGEYTQRNDISDRVGASSGDDGLRDIACDLARHVREHQQLPTQVTKTNSMTLVREVLSRCVPPEPDELRDQNAVRSLCQEPFLTGTDPEVPSKLPCGHIVGAGCLLKLLFRYSAKDSRNTCPMCRAPILESHKSKGELTAISRRRDFNLWQSRWNANVWCENGSPAPGDTGITYSLIIRSIDEWSLEGEELFVKLCHQVVNTIVDRSITDHQFWLERRAPLTLVINLATFGNFVSWMESVETAPNHTIRGDWMLGELPREELQAVREHLATIDRDDWRAYMEADEETFARLAGWHREIRESHSRLKQIPGHHSFMNS